MTKMHAMSSTIHLPSKQRHDNLATVGVVLIQGCLPTVGRAVVVNAAQLASYSQAKQVLLSTSESL